jgi:hypothetical protein
MHHAKCGIGGSLVGGRSPPSGPGSGLSYCYRWVFMPLAVPTLVQLEFDRRALESFRSLYCAASAKSLFFPCKNFGN